jgi:Raf kinase inhibitor-like YbhB/YbcL family protein
MTMNMDRSVAAFALIGALVLFVSQAPAQGGRTMTLAISSPDFPPGGDIPRKYTCDGADASPALSWSGAPEGTRSFALIAEDPDAPAGTWVHWVYYDLPASTGGLPENVGKVDEPPTGGHQGRNDFRRVSYGGPCPPPGKPHRYFFRIFALDRTLDLEPGATRKEVERAMQGHVLAQAELMGKYGR